MTVLIFWYLFLVLLNILAFPLAWRLFPALAERGYAFSRALGLMSWGFIFWLLASLGLLQNNTAGVLIALALLAGLSALAIKNKTSELVGWIRQNAKPIISVELVFLAGFALMAFIRSANPEALGTEKPMELAFINSIIHSPTFPPHDPWLSGYAISYYYFGYVITAMLAKVTVASGAIAFNLMLATLFALNADGAFGIVYNLISAYRARITEEHPNPARPAPIAGGLLAPIFLLVFGNFEGFLEILHRMGLFWANGQSTFWVWLGLKDLDQPPAATPGIFPERFWWWWRSSRVIMDYRLDGTWMNDVISEFPAFSYVLGDLHPHVLAMPFALLVIAAALNFYLGGWDGQTNFFGLARMRISKMGFTVAAVLIGGMAFLNTWDYPFYLALFCGAYLLKRATQHGWGLERFWELLELGLPLALVSFLAYLPFYLGFSSQAGGIIPNLIWPTRGAQLWVMFGPFFIFLLLYILFLWRTEKAPLNWKAGLGIAAAFALALWLLSWLIVFAGQLVMPDKVKEIIAFVAASDVGSMFVQATLRRASTFGGFTTIFILLAAPLAYFAAFGRVQDRELDGAEADGCPSSITPFTLLLVLMGALLVLGPEFFYLRDQFGYRINTIFKFYYQAWLFWSLASAFAAAVMLAGLRGVWRVAFTTLLVAVVLMAAIFSPMGYASKTNNFKPGNGYSLDASKYMEYYSPDDAAAVKWLQSAVPGVIAEAVGGSYSEYGRMATLSGLPTVLGWPGHEVQWRGGAAEMGSRESDMARLYETPDWNEARSILETYDISYVVVGNIERSKYSTIEQKFVENMPVVFQQGNTTIYLMP